MQFKSVWRTEVGVMLFQVSTRPALPLDLQLNIFLNIIHFLFKTEWGELSALLASFLSLYMYKSPFC